MKLTIKRCLLGLIASATMFSVIQAQEDEPIGAVQLGPKAQIPPAPSDPTKIAQAPEESTMSLPPGVQQFPVSPSPAPGVYNQPAQPGYNNYRLTPVDQVFVPRFFVNSYGGGLYGYGAGYSTVGAFVPYKIDDNSILFTSAMGMMTYDQKGGASVGGGWRHYMDDLDRIIGLSGWFDFDNGHYQPYQQLGLSFESLGRFVDYRVNGYVPVSNPNHIIYNNVTTNAAAVGNTIGLLTHNSIEQSYSGFDAELGGPTPILGRYGLNAYIGGYNFSGNGTYGGNFQGVSGRMQAQINEDISFGVQCTDDHVFGLNTQFQVFVNLPNGKSSRWLRNLAVKDRLTQNVFRQYRVIANTDTFNSYTTAINPNTNKPYFVANINPNATVNGNGSANSPFNSVAAYESLTTAQQQQYGIILVQPRLDGTHTNLDTSTTLDIYNGQKLLSTTIPQTFLTGNLPGTPVTLAATSTVADPILYNSSGGNVVTMVGGNTFGEQVSGFQIVGSVTGNGIYGNNVAGVNISNNNINSSLNGVLLTNLSGTIAPSTAANFAITNPQLNGSLISSGTLLTSTTGNAATGTEAQFFNNTIQNNYGNGIQVTNNAAKPLDVIVQGNTFSANGTVTLPSGTVLTAAQMAQIASLGGVLTAGAGGTTVVTVSGSDGLQLNAQAGSLIEGLIGGTNVAATSTTSAITQSNTFTTNTGNGLDLLANGGTLNFMTPTANASSSSTPFGILGNTFTSNGTGITAAETTALIAQQVANANPVNSLGGGFDGLHISTTNGSIASFNVFTNNFGSATDATKGNKEYGIGLNTDSGTTAINIGGPTTANPDGTTTTLANVFSDDAISAINFAATGTAILSYNINNNTLNNVVTPSIPPPQDSFTFSFDGLSGPGNSPFTITNTSATAGADITNVTWNLAGTPGSFVSAAPFVTTIQGTAIITPQNNTDVITGLSQINGVGVIAGSAPLKTFPANVLALNAAVGLSNNSLTLPLSFTNFTPSSATVPSVFTAEANIVQNGSPFFSNFLNSAQTIGSTITVTFHNASTNSNETATATVHSVPSTDSLGVAASATVFGPSIPGVGTGGDGIHIAAAGNATLGSSAVDSSIIQNNAISGYGGYGINVGTGGAATAQNVVIVNNNVTLNGLGEIGNTTPIYTGGGVELVQQGTSVFSATIFDTQAFNAVATNTGISSNFNNGIAIIASGTGGSLNVTSQDNKVTANGGNGLKVSTSNAANLTLTSNRDYFSGNGSGVTNPTQFGSDNIAIMTAGSSVSTITMDNVLADRLSTGNQTSGNGLSANMNDGSILNLTIASPADVLFTNGTQSSFSNNVLNGMLFNTNDTSNLNLSISKTAITGNTLNGIAFNRTGASVIQATIAQSSMNSNLKNGFSFQGLGGDPTEPTQQLPGTPTTINLTNDTLNSNGGDGAYVNLYGQAVLVLNATTTQFENNTLNGLRVDMANGAQFGYASGNIESNFDNVTISGNTLNGIMLATVAAELQQTGTSGALINVFIPGGYDPATLFDVNSVDGNSVISNNGANGILAQYAGGGTEVVSIDGDGRATPIFTTVIQGNGNNTASQTLYGGDGIREQINSGTDATLNVGTVLIGGPTAADSNKGNGINFQATSYFTIQTDPSNPSFATAVATTWTGGTAGIGNLNTNNTTIQNNGLNGINLLGDGLSAIHGLATDSNGNLVPFQNDLGNGSGLLNVDIANSKIINNALDGVNIEILGRMGDGRYFGGTPNSLVFTNNTISNNGTDGVYLEQNAGQQVRTIGGLLFRKAQFINPPTTPATVPLNWLNYAATLTGFSPNGFNYGSNAPIFLSNWMNLEVNQSSTLVMYGNTIQYNGTQPNIARGDGVHIRVGTDTYLSADIGGPAGSTALGNTLSGNIHTDFYVESFLSYNPATFVTPIPGTATAPGTNSVNAASLTNLSTVFLDDTAQLDMRFFNNTGNSIYLNSSYTVDANGVVENGNVTPSFAIYPNDPIKDYNDFPNAQNSGLSRPVQLFQVDDTGQSLDAFNSFTSMGITQGIANAFLNGDFNLTTVTPFTLDNQAFPQDSNQNPGNPFLP